jgi:hypothetical protein
MAAQESALRFICFYHFYTNSVNLAGYDGNMSNALDACVERLNETSKQELNMYVSLFENSMKLANSLFGEYAFRKVYSDYRNTRKSSINKSLMLAITVLLAVYSDKYKSLKNLTCELADLLERDKNLIDAISWGTSSKKNIIYVFNCLKTNLFDKFLL